jgi:hypothetical protein
MQDRFEKLGFRPEVKFEAKVIEEPQGKFPGRCGKVVTRADVPDLRGRLKRRGDLPFAFGLWSKGPSRLSRVLSLLTNRVVTKARSLKRSRIYNATFFASITKKRDPLCVFLATRYAQKVSPGFPDLRASYKQNSTDAPVLWRNRIYSPAAAPLQPEERRSRRSVANEAVRQKNPTVLDRVQELYLGSGCAFLRDDSRADKSSIAPKVVINNTAPGPPSGTLARRTVDVVDVVGGVCAWARTGRIKVAAAKAQALPIWL